MNDRTVFRAAEVADLPQMVQLSHEYRLQLSTFQPTMWRMSEDGDRIQIDYFGHLLQQGNVAAVVAMKSDRVAAFAIGSLVPAPPVYAPGGLTFLIDDFAIAENESWDTLGQQVLSEMILLATARGAVQAVVICPNLLEDKRLALSSSGFTVASEWWVRNL
ncbi:hypothetical protein [Fimbriimonas ginsengisoli]|uniref:Acetyltransferase n=1 Tax=Fimbriimonas ginsengisoli Gsoil 348 TaxID=661478 RepID=A0A068NVZ3_FIMGI|nr:hypothetical protein [Fimbriimonas ginsengisoli]AIE87693.1 Acetyltransferase [Fimbriimonas ginsengisoli Gsoil 348]